MTTDGATSSASAIPYALRALRHRNFRLFFAGQGLSLIGTWMQQVALGWLVYRLTDSAFALGLVAFVGQFPSFALAPFAGVLADSMSRHRLVIVTQLLSLLESTILATLVLTDTVQVWHLIGLASFLGVVNGFDLPARQSLLVELVEGSADLPNAIALNSSMFNGARLVGPAIAGVAIGLVGEGMVFALNATSYVAVLAALLAMDLPARVVPPRGAPVLRTLREGFTYAFRSRAIRAILTHLALLSLLGMPYTVLMPVFASDVLGGGPRTMGLLMSAAGLGALGGAVSLASRTTVRGLGRVIARAGLIFGTALIAFSLSRHLWLSAAVLIFAGFGLITAAASSNTVIQTIVDDDKRGRVMSLYAMAFMGMGPFGALLCGVLAARIGAPNTVLLSGVAILATGAWFTRSLPRVREEVIPIYQRLGIIPEIATGLQSATELRPKS